MIIIDLGSGNSCLNNTNYACSMVKAVSDIALPDVVIKWQLFQKASNNIPLNYEVFERAYRYAAILGIPTTASVFDMTSLCYLLTFGVPFVKIANNKQSQSLLKDIPDFMRVIYSTDDPDFKINRDNTDIIYTISKYPAKEKDYDKFGDRLSKGLSDHTTNFNLYKKFKPQIYECHFRLNDTIGLDSGDFARLPKDFEQIRPKEYTAKEILEQ